MKDVGPIAAARSGGLSDLAKTLDNNSERDCHTIMTKKFRLALPIRTSILKTEDTSVEIPILKMRTWIDFMIKNNCWHILTGLVRPDEERERSILRQFWNDFKQQFPGHQIFQMADQTQLEATAPICLHGDEGRGQKHKAFLVLSFRSILGRGLNPSEVDKRVRRVRKEYLKQKCNYKGHSFTSRFLIAGVRKQDYTGANDHVFTSLMKHCAEEAHSMITTPFLDQKGGKRWAMLIFITGDWPFLHKSGGFLRSFNNVMKRQNQVAARGICHQCMAGTPMVPFEQINTKRPFWKTTEFTEDPFITPSPFRLIPHVQDQLPALWTFDLFHCWHLGVAKCFIGGALVLFTMQENHGNVDDRFAAVSEKYQQFCTANGHRAHTQRITKEHLNWTTTRCFPVGAWHKGELSTVLMRFIEDYLVQNNFPSEPLLKGVKEAVIAINQCFRRMYRCDLWLSPGEAGEISGQAFRFLRRYAELTEQSSLRGMNLFSLTPKIHVIQKVFLRVHAAASSNTKCLNPLAVSVQQDEDFIGRPSRLSRRVTGSRLASQRVIHRYLQACHPQWIKAGYLVTAN